MGQVSMNVCTPMFMAYQRLAYFEIIANGAMPMKNFIDNRYVMLYCDNWKKSNGNINLRLEDFYYWDFPFFEIAVFHLLPFRTALIDIMKDLLDDGYYVVFDGADDYYLESRGAYHKHHMYHDGLLSGYNDKEGVFYSSGYCKDAIFRSTLIKEDSLSAALLSDYVNPNGFVIGAKLIQDYEVKRDYNIIYSEIQKYLNRGMYTGNAEYDKAEGIAVYECCMDYLNAVLDGKLPANQLDNRFIRMIWEHKKGMLERIKTTEMEMSFKSRYSDLYSEVVRLSDIARNRMIKFQFTGNAGILAGIVEIIKEIYRMEYEILSGFTDEMKNNIV